MTAPTRDRPRERLAIDPRIRDRRIEVIREAGRRRLRVTLVLTSAIVVIGLAYLAVRSPLLDVDRVRITGTHHEPVSEILLAARVHNGEPLLFVDTGAVARRIEQLPWVERARVHRDLPGSLDIAVTEYVPTVFARVSPSTVALFSASGRVVGFSHSIPQHVVRVIGLRRAPTLGAQLSPRGAADVRRHLPARLAVQIGAIDVGGPSVALDLRPRAGTVPGSAPEEIRLGSLDDLGNKGAAALAVLDRLAGQPCSYIDVAAPQAPVSRCP